MRTVVIRNTGTNAVMATVTWNGHEIQVHATDPNVEAYITAGLMPGVSEKVYTPDDGEAFLDACLQAFRTSLMQAREVTT